MQKFWLRQGARIAVQVNGARWLEAAAPVLAGWGVLAGCCLLTARRAGWDTRWIFAASAAVFVAVAVDASRRMFARWFTREDGLVRLDSVLGLHNRLVSAAAGVGDWPTPQPNLAGGFRWRWHRVAAPLLLGAAFLVAAARLPIPADAGRPPARIEAPLAWAQVETALEELKRAQVAEPEALAALEQKLEALRRQSPESWYSQGSLEAGAALQDETGHAIAALERHLGAAAQSLAPGQRNENGAPIAQGKETMWNEAMKGLQLGALPLNKSDMAALKQCASGNCSLSKEQLDALQKKIGQKGAACSMALGSLGDALKNGSCDGKLDSPQDQPNQEGGGGKTAQLGMRPTPTSAQPEQQIALESAHKEDAAPGDVVGVSVGAHKVDKEAVPVSGAGGAVSSEGNGGEAVWSITPSPREEAVLKAYFK